MDVLRFLIWCFSLICVNSIYIPNHDDHNNKNLNNFGIKTLGWQENQEHIEMHHNYSKVNQFRSEQKQINVFDVNQNQDFEESRPIYQQQSVNDGLEFSGDQKTLKINNHLREFSQNKPIYNQESVNNGLKFSGDQKTLKINNHLQEFPQNKPIYKQESVNNGLDFSGDQKTLKINNHLQEFSQNQQNVNDKIYKSCPKDATGSFIFEDSCSQFLNCWRGRGFVQNCAPGTLFNPKTLECDYQEKVECISGPNSNNRFSRQILINSENQIKQPSCPSGFSGMIPHYKTCSKYIQCDHGNEIIMDCPAGTNFDSKTNRCDFPYKSECINGENQNKLILNKYFDNLRVEFDGVTNNLGFLGVDSNGKKYFVAGKTKINDHLGEFQNLNQNYQNQNQNWVVKCPQGQSGLFPHPFDCHKFLNCDHGRTFIQECGPGTVFNPKIKVCDWPYNVQCQNQGINDDQRSGKVIQKSYENNLDIQRFYGIDSETFCIGREGFFENLKNCSVFFNCKNGKFSIGICHTGAQFNPKTNNCDDFYRCGSQNNQGNWNQRGVILNLNQNQGQSRNLNQNQGQSRNWNQGESWIQGQSWNQGQNQNWNQNRDQKQIQNLNSNQYVVQNEINLEETSTKSFLTTDTNADYIFDWDDLVEVPPGDHAITLTCDFKCDNQKCLSQNAICNGINDCSNGEDEKNCFTRSNLLTQFQKTEKSKMAVKEIDKYQNSTIFLCAKKCVESKNCKSINFRKNDGMCFILNTNIGETGSLFMLPNYDYYEYKKFSINCDNKFICSNQKCISPDEICDGKFDCVDKEDEKNCNKLKMGYSIQLIGSNKTNEGAIYVKAFNKAGFVCDDQFGIKDADVVCKEIGFNGAIDIKSNGFYQIPDEYKDDGYLMDDVRCLGNETSLKDCDFSGWGNHNCREKEIVGVVCKSSEEFLCPIDKWKCETSNECIPLDFLCDNVDDCDDNSDEASQYCESPIEIRLSNGNRPSEGRLEIRYHGTWGTVCDDDFNDDAAKVVCRYLGFKGSATSRKNGVYGPGKGPIWLDQIFCQGNETTLQECDRWDWGKHNCDHSEDVGIDCDDFQNVKSTPRNTQNYKIQPLKQILPLTCGLRNDNIFGGHDDVHFRVVKGSVAEKGMYPWQASIRVNGKSSQEHWCGAVIISNKFVLTAGHCLNGYQKGGFVVVAGDYDRNEAEGTEQMVNIEEFYVHDDFRKGTKMNNDLALIKLKGDGFRFDNHIGAICLPPINLQEEGLNCSISGFGSIQSGRAVASRELRAGFIPIQTREVCKMPHVYGEALTEGMLCAGSLGGGIDACDGDSGGPLACLNDGVFTLVGLTSWGQHCGYANKPGVYVKISYYRNWIDKMMKKHSD